MINSVIRNKIYILLLAVILLGGVIRFYRIDQVPVSLYWDEVSSTYNAYSIANTGKDEFGNSLPLLFRAFEDYKTPANIYLTAIPTKIFGLNEFSARFTSAFLGTLTIFAVFLMVKELLRKKIFEIDTSYIALLTALLVAISPWHIQFSRTGFEANSGLFFVIAGAFFLLKYINSHSQKFLYSGMSFFAVSMYFYRSIWIFVPLLLLVFLIIFRKDFFNSKNLKKTLISFLFFGVIILPFVPIMLSRNGMVRATQVGVVNNSSDRVFESAKKQEQQGGSVGKIIYNRRIVYVVEFGENYLKHFSPEFLFFSGDPNGRHGVRGVGILYAWAIIFVIPGLIALRKYDRKIIALVFSWIVISIIPAAVAVPSPHALRILNAIPMPQMIIALGLIWSYFFINKRYRMLLSAFVIGMVLFFFVNFIELYFGENAKKTSAEWADGYKQLTQYVFENENKYDKIVISGHYWQPYIYLLFYKKYDPAKFQKSGSKSSFDNYIFGGTSWDMNGIELGEQDLEKMANSKNILVALSPEEFSLQKEKLNVVKEIKNHDNELVFIIGTLR